MGLTIFYLRFEHEQVFKYLNFKFISSTGRGLYSSWGKFVKCPDTWIYCME